MVHLLVCGILTMAASAVAQPAQTGRIVGEIIDQANGFPLPGVTIEGPNNRVVVSDLDGKYAIDLPPGSQTVRFVMDGYATQTVTVSVVPGRPATVDVALPLGRFAETVVVSGTSLTEDTSSAEAALAARRTASAISDNLGAQELKANSDSSAAAGLQRVTGLSVVGDGFTFVRGLGERYSNTTLAGATIPSTQPERRVISLDLFPAALLDSVSVVKSYTPDRPSEFAGGLVEIIPLKISNRPILDVSYSIGANSQTLGDPVLDYSGSGTDWLAYDDGRRALPADFPTRRVIRGGIYTPEVGLLRSELEDIGESFENLWSPQSVDGKANQSWSAVAGNRWGKFGLIASLSQSYRGHYQEEAQNYYRLEAAGLSPFSEYEYRVGSNTATLAGTASAAYQFTSNNRLAFQFFSTSSGQRETRTFEGFNADADSDLRNSRLLWVEENVKTSQLTGDHLFPALATSRLEWRGSYSRSNRDEPDIREVLYEFEESIDEYILADESQSGFRMFNDLTEDSVDLGVSWSAFFRGVSGSAAMVKFGPSYTRRERDFSSRRFRYVPIDNTGLDLTLTPEQLFTEANIGPKFEFREETRATDTYNADQTTTAFFGMIDLPISGAWRLVGGARVERFEQHVDTFNPFSLALFGDAELVSAAIEETDVFPSANLVYAVRPDQNIRIGVSQTVNRPEFRELAPFEFTDIVGGRAVIGNPELRRSLVRNYDVRWEWFPGAREVLAASFFVKSFDDPIERFVEPTAQLRTSFTNADSARNLGLELEARKELSSHFLIGANYTFVDSEVTLTPFQTNVLTSLQRPLTGTSRNIVNLMGEARFADTTLRLLYNYFGDRILDVGAFELPDIYEQGRGTFDLALVQRIARMNLRFSLDNITNDRIEYTQGGLIQRAFDYGRTFAFHVGYSLF
jgi:outer membrane receptor protein involved in Fe transport